MRPHKTRGLRLNSVVAALVAAASLTAPAAAFEPTGNAIADAYLRAYEGPNTTVKAVGKVEEADGVVIIRSMTVETTSEDGSAFAQTVVLNDAELHGANLAGDVLTVDRATDVDGSVMFGDRLRLRYTSATAEGLRLKDGALAAAGALEDRFASVASGSVSDLTFLLDDTTFATADDLAITYDNDGARSIGGHAELSGLRLDGAAIGKLAGVAPLALVGDGPASLVLDAQWNAQDGILDIENLALSAPEVGLLGLSLRFDGIADDAPEERSEPAPDGAADETDGAADDEPQRFLSGSITIRDDGIAVPMFDALARQQQMAPGSFRSLVLNAISGALFAYDDPIFRTHLVGALDMLLDGNATVTVSSDPILPIPVQLLEQTADPQLLQALPGMLRLSVDSHPNE